MPETIAIIPARSGSERVADKNIKMLAGHPLIAYTIAAAQASGVADRIIVSTDSQGIAEIARTYGAEIPGLRPSEFATSGAHDIGFLRHAMEEWCPGESDQWWAILRPTSPLRSSASIARAHQEFSDSPWADSLRALRGVTEHPSKMWRLDPVTGESTTYLDQGGAFNGPISDQEQLFFQASSLEIVKRGAVLSHGSIAGKRVLGFFLPEAESHDVNVPHDWIVLEHLVSENPGLLPPIGKIT